MGKGTYCKFKLPSLKLEGDISLYNSLALHNSAMLATYGAIDERVKIMGYCIKVFVKVSMLLESLGRNGLNTIKYW